MNFAANSSDAEEVLLDCGCERSAVSLRDQFDEAFSCHS
jgi:hypothetical protein